MAKINSKKVSKIDSMITTINTLPYRSISESKYNIMFMHLLCASCAYYQFNSNLMTDSEYDALSRGIYMNRDRISSGNKLKDLIDWPAMENMTSLSYIRQYPKYIEQQTYKWIQLIESYLIKS